MSDPTLKIRVTGDLSGLTQSLNSAGAGFDNLGNTAQQAGSEATSGLNSAERAAKSLNDQLKRGADAVRLQRDATREAQRLARQQQQDAERLARNEEKIRQKLARDAEAERIRAQRAAERDAARIVREQERRADSLRRQSLNRTAQVAPQITDIVTQLGSGSNPLLILLQQGGQLRDIFGGIGPAIAGTGKAILGLLNPVVILTGTVLGLAAAYLKGQDEQLKFNRTLILTGNAAGKTADDLSGLAASLDSLEGSTRGSAAETINAIVESGRFAGEQIALIARAAEQLRNATGRNVSETIGEFSKISEGPTAAVDELNRRYGFLNGSIRQQIRSLEDQGRTQEAVTLAVNAYANAIEQRTPKIQENLGIIQRAWRGIKNGTREAYDELLNIGRDQTGRERFNSLFAERQRLQDELKAGGGFGDDGFFETDTAQLKAARERRITQITAELAALADAEQKAQQAAAKGAAQKRAVTIQGELENEARQYETAEQKRVRQRIAITNRANAAIADARTAGDAAAEAAVVAARDRVLKALDAEAAKATATVVGADAGLVQDSVERSLRELSRLYAGGTIQLREYFAEKAKLETRAIDARLRAAIAERNATQTTEERAKAEAEVITLQRDRAEITARIAREQAQAEALIATTSAAQTKEEAERAIAELERVYAAGEIVARDYYAKKRQLQGEAFDAEAQQAQTELLQADTVEKRIAALNRITTVERQRAAAGKQLVAEQAEAEKALGRTIEDVRARIAEAEGDQIARRKLELARERDDLLKKFADDPGASALINRLFDVELAQARADQIEQQAADLQARLRQGEDNLALQMQAGTVSQMTGEQQLQTLRNTTLEQLRRLRDALAAMAAADPSPALTAKVEELNGAILQLEGRLPPLQQKIQDLGESALTNFFTDLVTGAKSAGEAFRGLVLQVVQGLARIYAEILARKLIMTALGGGSGGGGFLSALFHGGGMVGQGTQRVLPAAAAAMFAFAPRMHEGGIAGLKPDEVPAILKQGERVLSPQETARYNSGEGSGGGANVRIINTIDPEMTAEYFNSPSGEKTLVNLISRNSAALRTVLA